MRVVDLGTTPDLLVSWVDPVAAALLYPEDLEWFEPEPAEFGDEDTTDPEPDPFTFDFRVGGLGPNKRAKNTVTATALAQATWLLDVLTRRRLHGVECWTEDYVVHSCEVKLRRGPVIDIQRVDIVQECGRRLTPMTFDDYCIVSPNTISVCCGCGFGQSRCGCGQTVLRVSYQIGSNMPPGTGGLVAWLAAELSKAAQDKKCALPERVSSVTRQGVSWSILDPQDFLDKGRTGIGRVDQWLEAVKLATGSGTLIDPLKSDRAFAERRDCGVGAFGDNDPADPQPDPFSSAFNR